MLPAKEGEKGLTDYMIQHVCARSWVCCDNDFGRPEETLHSCQIIVYTESSAYESVEIIGKKHAAVLNGRVLCSAAGSVAQRRGNSVGETLGTSNECSPYYKMQLPL